MSKTSVKQRVTQLMEWKKTLKSQRSKPKEDDSKLQRVNLGYNVNSKQSNRLLDGFKIKNM